LIVIPPFAAGSWETGMWMAAGLSCVALLLVVAVYRSPPGLLHAAAGRLTFNLPPRETALAVLSGFVWAFYNMSFILLLTFGPAC
jgi:hypothetical protein